MPDSVEGRTAAFQPTASEMHFLSCRSAVCSQKHFRKHFYLTNYHVLRYPRVQFHTRQQVATFSYFALGMLHVAPVLQRILAAGGHKAFLQFPCHSFPAAQLQPNQFFTLVEKRCLRRCPAHMLFGALFLSRWSFSMLALRSAKAAAGGKLPWIFGESCGYGVAWSIWPS